MYTNSKEFSRPGKLAIRIGFAAAVLAATAVGPARALAATDCYGHACCPTCGRNGTIVAAPARGEISSPRDPVTGPNPGAPARGEIISPRDPATGAPRSDIQTPRDPATGASARIGLSSGSDNYLWFPNGPALAVKKHLLRPRPNAHIDQSAPPL